MDDTYQITEEAIEEGCDVLHEALKGVRVNGETSRRVEAYTHGRESIYESAGTIRFAGKWV